MLLLICTIGDVLHFSGFVICTVFRYTPIMCFRSVIFSINVNICDSCGNIRKYDSFYFVYASCIFVLLFVTKQSSFVTMYVGSHA